MKIFYKDQGKLPFALARYFAWASLVLIIVSSLVLAIFIGNTTRSTLITRQENYSLLLAENLNAQIYRRFTLPIVLAHGRIALRDQQQYERLDDVVQSIVHGLQIESIKIYDTESITAYASNTNDLGYIAEDLEAINKLFAKKGPSIDIFQDQSFIKAFFASTLEPNSFRMRTLYPLSILEPSLNTDLGEPVLGVLEVVIDITPDYITVIHFQRIIFIAFFASSLLLFLVLQFFARYAERTLTERLEQNRKLEASLHQSEKLASMGRTVASIAHEIRNPLGIIRSSSELLLKRTDNVDQVSKNILNAIFDESCRLSATVGDFLDYAKPRKMQLEPTDLSLVLDRVRAFMESEFTRLNVKVTYDYTKLFVLADADLLYRAIYNIMANAIQAMENIPQKEIFIKASLFDKNSIELIIIDNGPGFEQEALEHILDPFFTTKENGTGLGLSIVNTIISSHNGMLEIYNNKQDGGAEIRIVLPRYFEGLQL